jgi:hypothetical protein
MFMFMYKVTPPASGELDTLLEAFDRERSVLLSLLTFQPILLTLPPLLLTLSPLLLTLSPLLLTLPPLR